MRLPHHDWLPSYPWFSVARFRLLLLNAQVRSAVGAKLGQDVNSLTVEAYKTQVVSTRPRPEGLLCWLHALLRHIATVRRLRLLQLSSHFCVRPVLSKLFPNRGVQSQVAGVNYKVKATVNGSTSVIITAHRPLPHTGLPLDVKSAAAGSDL